ncbi:hypothetical protein OIV83_001555 [Microbotryomycetes sp. JL201]|nr:hypothetical protein OIV83_001555 [Microbotryomycetes sp. JL201]
MADTIARLESQVLHEYAQVSSNLEQIAAVTQSLSGAQPHLLNEVRPLERKLGLVLTLFKASVWSLIRKREDEQEFE